MSAARGPKDKSPAKCGFFGCRGCSACDPDGSPPDVEETDLQRMQRKKREEDKALREGKPTLKVKLGDLLVGRGKR